jgi:ketosteroid isomerase-like protein
MRSLKIRLLGTLVGLAISFALPIYAQQKDVADPETTQRVFASFKTFDEAINNHDAAALAAFYARDAILVTPDGPVTGRQAIQRWYADVLQRLRPKNRITKVDWNAVHLIGTAGNEMWATAEWSETGQGKNGEPIPIKGYQFNILVREGDDWRTRVTAWNSTPDSVLLINKTFAPRPAATPSSTASPSNK